MYSCIIYGVSRRNTLCVEPDITLEFVCDITLRSELCKGKHLTATTEDLGFFEGDGALIGRVTDYELMQRFELLAALWFKYDVSVEYRFSEDGDSKHGVLIKVYDKESGMPVCGDWYDEKTIQKLGEREWQWKLSAVSNIINGHYYAGFKRVSEREKIGEN